MTPSILVAGATGYIGGRLLARFEAAGHRVRCLVRRDGQLAGRAATTEVVVGDCLDPASLAAACTGIRTAFYLVHSMSAGQEFAQLDRDAARNFAEAARRAGIQRIIYLGGLVDEESHTSLHLRSRAETGATLRAGGVPVTEFRASIVIGAGSLSFEMISALVERLPVMICPRWVATLTQPIAVDDVLRYLEGALDLDGPANHIFEIGGPEVVSYGAMMREYARLRGLRRLLLPVPFLTPHLSGLWLGLVTPAHARIGRALVEGLRSSTIVRSDAVRDVIRVTPTPLSAALAAAIDAGAPQRVKVDRRTAVVNVPPELAFAPVRRIGGAAGWYFATFLWRLRGWMDRMAGGVGMDRGRRDCETCRVGDPIDGWTVEAFEEPRRLRLSADMRLPGRGWLEFTVTPLEGGTASRIEQTATFDPRGLLGRIYWYAVLPLHELIFRGMLRQIVRRAEADHRLRTAVVAS
ncbi:MAG TPA: SDR family oxidoreductase [Vicinamibacterales bacterium]